MCPILKKKKSSIQNYKKKINNVIVILLIETLWPRCILVCLHFTGHFLTSHSTYFFHVHTIQKFGVSKNIMVQSWFPQKYEAAQLFSTMIQNVSWAANQHIKMISVGIMWLMLKINNIPDFNVFCLNKCSLGGKKRLFNELNNLTEQ